MRKALIVLAVVAVVLIAADFGLRAYAQSVASRELQQSLDLQEKPEISIGGWPFIPRLVTGRLPSVTISAEALTTEGITFREVDVVLSNVRYPAGQLLGGGGGTIRARRGRGTATLGAAGFTALLREQGVPLNVELEEGELLISDELTAAEAEVSLSGRSLTLEGPGGTVSVDLPEVLEGATYSSVEIEEEGAVFTVILERPSFRVE